MSVVRAPKHQNAGSLVKDKHAAMTPQEAYQTFDLAARRYLSISGEEFLKKWRSGQFKGKREIASKVDAVSILLPLVDR